MRYFTQFPDAVQLHVLKFLDLSDLLGRFACVSAVSARLVARVLPLLESVEITTYKSLAYEAEVANLARRGSLPRLRSVTFGKFHSYRCVEALMKHCPKLVHVALGDAEVCVCVCVVQPRSKWGGLHRQRVALM